MAYVGRKKGFPNHFCTETPPAVFIYACRYQYGAVKDFGTEGGIPTVSP
jgi:hypothetical protein